MPRHKATAQELENAASGGNGLLGKLLDSLPPEVKESLLTHAILREVSTGTVIVESGQHSEEIGYVISGTLAMVQLIEHDRKHIIGLLVPTDIYGRLFDGPSSYQIEALSTANLMSFPRALFETILRKSPETERLFLVHLLDEMDAAREWLLLISGRRIIHRVASFLTILMRRSRVGKQIYPLRLHVPMSRKDLAHYLGARPESLSRAFHELENNGILKIIDPYVFEILDQEALMDVSGDDLTIEKP